MNDRFQILREVINQRLMHDSNIIIGRPTVSPDRKYIKVWWSSKTVTLFRIRHRYDRMVFDLMKSTYPSH